MSLSVVADKQGLDLTRAQTGAASVVRPLWPLSRGLAWKLVLFVMYVAPPLFYLIALEFFLRLRGRGLMSHQPWVRLAMLLWLGVLFSFTASACMVGVRRRLLCRRGAASNVVTVWPAVPEGRHVQE